VNWGGFPLTVTRISGSSTDGVYQATFTVPAQAANGSYSIILRAADVFGNGLAGYSRSVDFTVQNGSNDYDPPSVSIETNPAASYKAGDEVTFTLRGTDELGIAGISTFVLGPNGRLVDDSLNGWIDASTSTLTAGTAKDGIYTVKIKIAATSTPGDYKFLFGYADIIGSRAWTGYPARPEAPGFTVVA
jgi:hypothetical protein